MMKIGSQRGRAEEGDLAFQFLLVISSRYHCCGGSVLVFRGNFCRALICRIFLHSYNAMLNKSVFKTLEYIMSLVNGGTFIAT
jgi:hypothetical protein